MRPYVEIVTYANTFAEANRDGEPPVDVWGRQIRAGSTLMGYALSFVTRVEKVNLKENEAGFYINRNLTGSKVEEMKAGAHVSWEIVALPGKPVPASKEEVRRDSTGRPILGPVNGLPRQLPETACRVHR